VNIISKIIIIYFLLCPIVFAIEIIDKVKNESKSAFKTLTRKSLTKEETIKFISEYVITIDDKRGNGLVTYYFDDMSYKRYKNFEIISENSWKFTKFGNLILFYDGKKNTWKIQPSKKNTINIKKKFNPIGKLYEFSYQNKTDFYLTLEEKKLH
jgi:hypothetical protein